MELVPIGRLIPDPANARRHDKKNMAAIDASLERFGAARSVVLDGADIVRAGNGTLDRARAAGVDRVLIVEGDGRTLIAVRRKDWTEDEAIAYGVADNRASELGSWDDQGLAAALRRVQSGGIELAAVGFSGADFKAALARLVPEPVVTEGETPAAAPTRCQPGELWAMGDHRLLCGDATTIEAVRRLLPDGPAALLVTSPPYWAKQEYDRQVGLEAARAFMKATAAAWAGHVRRRVVVNTGNTMENSLIERGRSGVRILLDAEWVNAWREVGWELRNRRIWVKSGPLPNVAPISDAVDESCEALLTLARPGQNEGGQERCGPAWAMKGYWDDIKGVGRDVVGDDHPCPFPVELAGRFIQLYSEAGDVVVDPFMGSGTTILAAEQLGRRGYGTELDPRYCDVVLARWEKFTGRPAERVIV